MLSYVRMKLLLHIFICHRHSNTHYIVTALNKYTTVRKEALLDLFLKQDFFRNPIQKHF